MKLKYIYIYILKKVIKCELEDFFNEQILETFQDSGRYIIYQNYVHKLFASNL